MMLSWNLVAKNMHPREQLLRKLRDKISKLEQHLQHFHPEAVHLQVGLDRHPKKELFTATLTLRVPSNVLRSSKSAADPIPALDRAVKALLREVSTFKSGRRREALWRKQGRRQPLQEIKPLRFAPVPLAPGEGPQTLGEVVREMVRDQYEQLVFYVRRQISRAEMEELIPGGSIDPEAVADEVARQAIARPEDKPADRTYRLWLYSLARRDLQRRFRDLRQQAATTVSVEESSGPSARLSSDAVEEGRQQGSRFDASQGLVEPEADAGLPDAHIVSPDVAASESDLLDYLHLAAQDWPREERSIFELHFLEGFEFDEVAMLEKLTISQVRALVAQVQARLRNVLSDAVEATSLRKRPGASLPALRLTNALKRAK